MRSLSNYANLYPSGPLQAKGKSGWSIRTIFCKCLDELASYKEDGLMQKHFCKRPGTFRSMGFLQSGQNISFANDLDHFDWWTFSN